MNTLNVILNGKPVTGFEGETILSLCKRNGIEIPTLCHDDRLEPFSSCFICVVEVEKLKNLQPSCSTRITEGMSIITNSEKALKSRKAALELLFSNHYADCVAPCKMTCPAGVDVQGYISLIEKGLYNEAIGLIKEANPLPAVCGRVCVRPCEVACRRNLLDEGYGVGIDYLKRFAADIDLESANKYRPQVAESTGKKVAIVGAGPGGLSAAYWLQQKGHQCDIFEAAPQPGGWLRYGIPEYRLPNDILDKEIACITELGVNIFCNKKLGDNLSYKELKEKYHAVILTIGSQKGTSIGCEGDDAGNIFSGIDFLKQMELTGERFDFKGKKIAVVGGGNTAMDCCRSSIRCGSTDVTVIYRRTENEMPANPIEIHESKLEGVKYEFLTAPVKVNKDEKGNLKSITLIKMELGEPDASGRRRPVPIEGSEYDMEFDYVLAAIGQKTVVNFIDDVNKYAEKGELKANRWGDIDADKETLQTGIESMFAAGDGVTGPATIIEAIAQAKIASTSCHNYLMGLSLKSGRKEFIIRRDDFKKQEKESYIGKYVRQLRHEMPTLDPSNRVNFKEVELGYENEEVAHQETARCLECGCAEYFTCDLRKYGTDYQVSATGFSGEFKEYPIDYSHPFIELDKNKCILCSRCVRICRELNGANALGLVARGFETYVAPSMGQSLLQTTCETCGLCISTCPTGAIIENTSFKPGPVLTEQADTICNYCSVGCSLTLHHINGYIMKVTGREGLANQDGNICRYGKFGYNVYNDKSRITRPLLKENGKFREISFHDAYKIIKEKIQGVKADENAFFAGARLTNEEQYLIQKFARAAAKTNNIHSFHYLHSGEGYIQNSLANVPFEQIPGASRIYLIGSEINVDNGVAGFIINNTRVMKGVPVELVTEYEHSSMKHKVDRVTKVNSYYHFVKAMNHFLLSSGLENMLFIKDNCSGFEAYKKALLNEDYELLVKKSGCDRKYLEEFALQFNNEMNAIIVFSEKEICPETSFEIFNLDMITGKLCKTSNGLVSLKEKNNSHGLIDMGVNPDYLTGTQSIDDKEAAGKFLEKWGIKELPQKNGKDILVSLGNGSFKNFFIFGEDPIGCALNKNQVAKWFEKKNFLMVQDLFMSDTAEMADLILPASFHIESGGSFTNSQKMIQEFDPVVKPKVDKVNHEQLIDLLKEFGLNGLQDRDDISNEIFGLLPQENNEEIYPFHFTKDVSPVLPIFDNGCDLVFRKFRDDFETKMKEATANL